MNVLVTGGGGFLGGAIVRMMLDRGATVRSLARGDYPELRRLGVEVHRGDLANVDSVRSALEGCDLVFHVAAKAGVWGSYQSYFEANVVGTQNVIDGCRETGVSRLVFTSTPSVVHAGGDIENGDESLPYALHFETHYPKTKCEAERRVLAANGARLATVALRPHLIWGPGDNHLVPRILERGRQGRLRRIGSAEKKVDATYIDNAAHAHVLAAERLSPGSPISGKAYFVANDEPMPLWELINSILEAGGERPVTRSVPVWLAYSVGAILETYYRLSHSEAEPPMTRFVARQLSTAHWYNLAAARRDLDYVPLVSTKEGLQRLRLALSKKVSRGHS